MLSVETVQQLILERVPVGGLAFLNLEQCVGHVLAEPISTPRDIPAWSNSAMDGYAVQVTDWTGAEPLILEVSEEIPAGKIPTEPVRPGHCARIFTGALLPPGADAVVMQERTELLADGRVQVNQLPRRGQFIRYQGDFRKAGDQLIAAGTRLTPAEIGILASINRAQAPVYGAPLVAILSTGDELVPVGTSLQPGQVVDSNQPTLAALVRQCGGIPWTLGIVPDDPQALRTALIHAQTADFILSSGGVSVGAYDYVEQVLTDLGAEILVRQVNLKPGKPLTFAHGGGTCFWGLPGNPMAVFVGFWLTVYPALRKFSGYPATAWVLPEQTARLTAGIKAGGDRRHYLRGRFKEGTFEPFGLDNSANFANLSGVNSFAILEQGETAAPAGGLVRVIVLPI